jgi:uracil-DNA glycosylase
MNNESGCKISELRELTSARKSCRICLDRDPGKIHAGAFFDFDPDVISYWSQWLGHPSPQLLIVGQDFGDLDYFKKFRGLDDPHNKTNENLCELLWHAGLTPSKPPLADRITRIFLTNSILCLKEPPMNSPLRETWVRACAINHLRPLIERLRPPIVVAMGGPAWQATQFALEIKNAPKRICAAAGGTWTTRMGTRIFAVGHCSGLGVRNRPWQMQLEDWSRIGDAVRQIL